MQNNFNPLAMQASSKQKNQISTTATLKKAGGQSYQRLQDTAQALTPAL